MANIYSISDWTNSQGYLVNSIIKNGNYYFYSLLAHTSPASRSFDENYLPNLYGNTWTGRIVDDAGVNKPLFNWRPDYSSRVKSQPKVKNIQYGDGYSQRIKDGINNNLIQIQIIFQGRDNAEIRAILHFLYARQGTESFIYTPTAPYDSPRRFICQDWEHDPTFHNTNAVQATFNEVVN